VAVLLDSKATPQARPARDAALGGDEASSRSGCPRQIRPCVLTLASPTHFVEGGGTWRCGRLR